MTTEIGEAVPSLHGAGVNNAARAMNHSVRMRLSTVLRVGRTSRRIDGLGAGRTRCQKGWQYEPADFVATGKPGILDEVPALGAARALAERAVSGPAQRQLQVTLLAAWRSMN